MKRISNYGLIFLAFLAIVAGREAPSLAEITHDIITTFNIACKSLMHRPVDVRGLSVAFLWWKNREGLKRKPLGSFSLKERQVEGFSHRCLNIVMGSRNPPEVFAKFTRSNRLDNQFWVVFLEVGRKETFFDDAELPFSTEVLLVELAANHTVSSLKPAVIFDVYRAGLGYPVRFNRIGSWNSTHRLVITAPLNVYRRRSDLEGRKLRIGVIQSWPIAVPTGNGHNDWSGLFPSIWHEVARSINVTTEYVRSSHTGSLRPGGTWTGLIGMAVRGEIDIIVSDVTMNSRRTDVLDFTRPILTTKHQIYFKEPGTMLNWMAVLKPFPNQLWVAIFVWLVVCAACMAFCYYVCTRAGLELMPYPSLGFLQFIFWVLQSLCNQGLDVLPSSSTCRIIVLASYLVSAVVIPSYSASLISSLTTKTFNRPFNSLDEMLANGRYKLLVANNTAEYDYFANSKDAAAQLAFSNLIQSVPARLAMTNVRQALHTVCNERQYAVFGIEAVLSLRIAFTPNLTCSIIPMARPMSSVHLSMALPKLHHLHGLIDYHLNEMVERGIMERITRLEWPKPDTNVELWTQVSPEEVFQIFVLVVIGLFSSTAILLLELFWHKINFYLFKTVDWHFTN